MRAGSTASILRQPLSPWQALMPQPRRLVISPSSLTISPAQEIAQIARQRVKSWAWSAVS